MDTRARSPPKTVITSARSRLFQKLRCRPAPQARFSAISTGMKMPEEPHTIRRSESTSRPREKRVRPRTDSATACGLKGMSSCSSTRSAVPARRPKGSCSEAKATTRRSGKRQSRKLNATAFVRTAISRETRSEAARRSLGARASLLFFRAMSGLLASPPEVGGHAEGEYAAAEERLDGALEERVDEEDEADGHEHRGHERVAGDLEGPGGVGPRPPQHHHRRARERVEEQEGEDHER